MLHSSWLPSPSEFMDGARLLAGLPGFLRRSITPPQARAVLQWRLANRESEFLARINHNVFGRPTNPYRRLLALAGCEPGDLERLVQQDGVEGALQDLY